MYGKGKGTSSFSDNEINNVDCSKSKKKCEDNMHNCPTSLLTALREKRDISLVKELISEEQVLKVNEYHENCLHIAVRASPFNLEVIKELINCNADVNGKNLYGETPLHVASVNPVCDLNLVKILIDNRAKVNIKNNGRETPIFLYIRRCYEEEKCEEYFKIIQFLLDNGAKPNLHNYLYEYPAHIAACLPSFINLKLVELLSNYGAILCRMNYFGETVLHKVVKDKNNIKLFQFVINKEKLLLCFMNDYSQTPLHTAVFHGSSLEIIEEILNKTCHVKTPDNAGNYPIHYAQSASFSVINSLIKHGSYVNWINKCGWTPLMEAVRANNHSQEAILALIYFGARINQADFSKYTALHFALSNQYTKPETVHMLLENKANPFLTKFGNPPPVFFCSNNVATAEIYIQYVLLNILGIRGECQKPSKELMCFDCYENEMNSKLSRFRDSCIEALLNMKMDKLSEKVTLYDFVYSKCNYKGSKNTFSDSFVGKILKRINSEKYISCKFLLLSTVEEDELIEYLDSIKIFPNVLLSTDTKQNSSDQDTKESNLAQNFVRSVGLDISIFYLSRFLDKKSLLNLALCFCKI